MTLDFFLKNYSLDDLEVKKMFIKDNKLNLVVKYNVYLELIANGYRPEMNMDVEKTFIFNTKHDNHTFKTKKLSIVSFNDDILKIKIDNQELDLFGDVIAQ